MTKDTIVLLGAIVGVLAGLLAVMDRVLSIRERFLAARRPVEEAGKALLPQTSRGPERRHWMERFSSHLLRREVLVIIPAGILLNYLGLAVAVRLKSILYLDMMGTSLVAFLLGPWWAAITGLMSNSFVNWLLYPEPKGELIVFPWSLVNMAGGIYWGIVARRAVFAKYLVSVQTRSWDHMRFLAVFGVAGAAVMSVVGTLVQAALAEKTVLALDPGVAGAIDRLLIGWQASLRPVLAASVGDAWGNTLAWGIPSCLQNWVRYIPDKTLSAAFGLAAMRYGFPLYERELVLNQDRGRPPGDAFTSPLLLGALYAPSFLVLMSQGVYRSDKFWVVWCLPWAAVLMGVGYLIFRGPSAAAVRAARQHRLESYGRCLGVVESSSAYRFFDRLRYATIAASTLFVVALPLLEVDFYRVAFNFLCVVYGFLLALHLVRISVCQHNALSKAAGQGTDGD